MIFLRAASLPLRLVMCACGVNGGATIVESRRSSEQRSEEANVPQQV